MSFDNAEFNQLTSDRLAYIDGLRRNKGFEAGIRRLLTELYPDNAHFIYELLQNAEVQALQDYLLVQTSFC